MGDTQTLHGRILAAAAEAGYVQKSDRNTQQNYSFAGDEAISAKFREAMLKHGVLVYPAELEFHEIKEIPRQGKDVPNVLVSVRGALIATDGQSELRAASLGQGIDVGDKAVYKALTGFKKYGYRMLVMMVTGDDPEQSRADESDERPPSSVVGSTGQAQGERTATKKQKDLIHAKANEAGLTKEQLAQLRKDLTDKRSSREFTNADVDKMLKGIAEIAAVQAATGGKVEV